MPVIKTGNAAHDAALIAAEHAHQIATAPGATAAQIRAADLVFLRACRQSCIINNGSAGVAQFTTAIRELTGSET